MEFRWNEEKNDWLKKTRDLSFEIIEDVVKCGGLISVIDHPNQKKYPYQKMLILRINDYIYNVPCVIESDGAFFLKTIYPSRKGQKIFGSN